MEDNDRSMNEQLWMMPTVASFSRGSVMVSRSGNTDERPNKLRTSIYTYGTLIAQWMEAVERVSILLLVAPNKVYPCWQVLADVVALKSLAECR
jgi:hypothetical protein